MPSLNSTCCDRCNGETQSRIMSKFNTDMICPTCKQKEREHPQYQHACDVELEQCKQGNYNFEGIGKPQDL